MRWNSVVALLVAGAVAVWPVVALAADADKDVEAKIESALKDYKAGKTGEAMTSLQEAISLIQKSSRKGMAAFFPKAPDGWEAGKLDSQSVSGGGEGGSSFWTTLSQDFTRKKDQLRVSVSLANSPEMIKAQKGAMEVFKNAETLKAMNSDPAHQYKLVEQAGWVGLRTVEKGKDGDKGRCEIILFTDACLLTLRVDSADEAVLDQFFKQIDLKALAAAAPKAKKSE